MGNCCFGVVDRGFWGLVAVEIGRHRVHTAAADERSLAIREAEICKEVGGGNINGGIIRGCGGAVGECTCDTTAVDSFRFHKI